MVLHGAGPVLLCRQTSGLITLSVLQPLQLEPDVPLKVFLGRCSLTFNQKIGECEIPLRLILEEYFQITGYT